MNSLGYDSLVMSKYYRPSKHERLRLRALRAESDFAPNRPRSKSVVTVESTHKSKLGAQHIRKQLRRQPTFHGDVYQSTRLQTDYQDTSVGIKDNPQPFTQLPNTFTLTDSERAKLETMTMPTKSKQLRLIPMLADFGYKFTYEKLPIVQQTEYVFMLWWADAIKNRIPSSN